MAPKLSGSSFICLFGALFLLHICSTWYGWLAHFSPVGSSIPQETPSFARCTYTTRATMILPSQHSRTSTGALPPVPAGVYTKDNSFLGMRLWACSRLARLQVSPCL